MRTPSGLAGYLAFAFTYRGYPSGGHGRRRARD